MSGRRLLPRSINVEEASGFQEKGYAGRVACKCEPPK
jgi:hypothetical protein